MYRNIHLGHWSSRRLKDVFGSPYKTKNCYVLDIFNTYSCHNLKTYSTYLETSKCLLGSFIKIAVKVQKNAQKALNSVTQLEDRICEN